MISKAWVRYVAMAALLAAATVARADAPPKAVTPVKVMLGDAATVTGLYSYPNNTGPQTLAQTVAHYLEQSAARDGLRGATVRVEAEGGKYYAVMEGVPPDYAERIARFLQVGAQGVTATGQLQQAGKWNDKQWRFFLPLGLAMDEQKSAQLLHFPPDYSLTDQDYLNSKTSRRWETLLELNGAPSESVALFERIVDIAPVAAPADAGKTLADTYGYYKDYAYAMLNYSVATPAAKRPLPVVAYGSPVRDWVKANLGATLRVSAAPVHVKVGQAAGIPMLGANHPSLFWYVAKDSRTDALRVMRDDLVAACWQVRMGDNPALDIDKTLAVCSAYWDRHDAEVCEQTEIQGYDKTPAEARKICAKSARRLMRAARAVREEDMLRLEHGMPAEHPAH